MHLHVGVICQLPQGSTHQYQNLPPTLAVQDWDYEAGEAGVRQDGGGLADEGFATALVRVPSKYHHGAPASRGSQACQFSSQ